MAIDVIQKIADQIAHHRAEILRLESALQVIAEMGDKSAAKAVEKPMITIRKNIDHEAAATKPPHPTKGRKIDKSAIQKFEARVLADLQANGASHSRDIGARLRADKKKIWNRLYSMHKSGMIIRSGDGLYRLPDDDANAVGEGDHPVVPAIGDAA